jgi:hypothetical protein
LPPGPFAWPIIGNVFNINFNGGKLPEDFMDYAKRYGPIFRLMLGDMVVVVLNGYDMVNEALVKKADMFSDRPSLWIMKDSGTGE